MGGILDWRDLPGFRAALSGEAAPVVPVADDGLLGVWQRFCDCCDLWGVVGSREVAIAAKALRIWRAAIDKGEGAEWARKNAKEFEEVMKRCGVSMTFEQVYSGRELRDVAAEVFECRGSGAGNPHPASETQRPSPLKGEGGGGQLALPEVRVMRSGGGIGEK